LAENRIFYFYYRSLLNLTKNLLRLHIQFGNPPQTVSF
jgi:hypothetical protein